MCFQDNEEEPKLPVKRRRRARGRRGARSAFQVGYTIESYFEGLSASTKFGSMELGISSPYMEVLALIGFTYSATSLESKFSPLKLRNENIFRLGFLVGILKLMHNVRRIASFSKVIMP